MEKGSRIMPANEYVNNKKIIMINCIWSLLSTWTFFSREQVVLK